MMSSQPLTRMEWEKPYLEALIDRLHPFGQVLEVGFALGFSANRIQTYHISHHTIIESDPITAAKARKWAEGKPNVTVIEDSWEKALPPLGTFDAIFFNDFDPNAAAELAKHHKMGTQIVKQGKELIAKVKEEIPHLTSIRYTQHDLEEFFNQVGKSKTKELSIFLFELKTNGQISDELYGTMAEKYHLEKKVAKPSPEILQYKDPMLTFLQACLSHHMREGSRFSCFSPTPISYYDNPPFFDAIITNPNVEYQEQLIPITVPPSCPYYQGEEALLILVEKM